MQKNFELYRTFRSTANVFAKTIGKQGTDSQHLKSMHVVVHTALQASTWRTKKR